MAEHKSKLESVREWVVENKLRTVGNFIYFFFGSTKILNLFIFIINVTVMLILVIFVTKGVCGSLRLGVPSPTIGLNPV